MRLETVVSALELLMPESDNDTVSKTMSATYCVLTSAAASALQTLVLVCVLQCCASQHFPSTDSSNSPHSTGLHSLSPSSLPPLPDFYSSSSLLPSFADQITQGADVSVGNTAREGELSAGSVVQLPVLLNLRRYTSVSVRTCSPGPLLVQRGHTV
ncbi:hypothetical protein FHG87_002517 [Trinorchestia longiramus]|nr:hypothetical protein FHG87_002517 [Trinorchestia longiramus]